MEDFKTRREEYCERLKAYDEVLPNMIIRLITNGESDEAEVLLTPKNERELKYVEAGERFATTLYRMLGKLMYADIDTGPYEENEGMKEIVRVLTKMNNGETIDYYENLNASPENKCKLYYGALVYDLDNEKDYLAKAIGLDLNNSFDESRFDLFSKKIEAYGRSINKSIANSRYKNYSDEELESLSIFSKEFERLCNKYDKDLYKENACKSLVKTITLVGLFGGK